MLASTSSFPSATRAVQTHTLSPPSPVLIVTRRHRTTLCTSTLLPVGFEGSQQHNGGPVFESLSNGQYGDAPVEEGVCPQGSSPNILYGICNRFARKLLSSQRLLEEKHRSGSLFINGPLSTMALAAPLLPETAFSDLASNRVFITGLCAWFVAQFAKIFTKRFKKGIWDIRAMVEPGGMPSSHSALCSGVTTAIALTQGLGSPLFASSLAFSVIVMYDAMGVRQHAGKQAEVLNQVINELMVEHPVVAKIKLKEVLGHTPRQVICGAVLGIVTALALPQSFWSA